MLARAARSGTRGLPPLGLGGSGGSKGSMNIHNSFGTNSFVMELGPTLVFPLLRVEPIKPRRAGVMASRPTAASCPSCRAVPGTPRSSPRRFGRRRYPAPQRACRWELSPAARPGVCHGRSTARPPCHLRRPAPRRSSASRGTIRGTHRRNPLAHQHPPPLQREGGSGRRAPLVRPQHSSSPRSKTPPRNAPPTPCFLPPTSLGLLYVRLYRLS